jgi:hypothetical protein
MKGFGCRPCNTSQLHCYFTKQMLESQNVKVNGRQRWFKSKPWVDKNQLKYDTHVFLKLDN